VGLPGVWTVLLLRAVVVHPAGCALPSPCCGETAVAFGEINPLGTRDDVIFVAAFPTAHTLARLRIAGRVAASVARLATGWAGSPLAGRGSHPLDDEPNFMSIIAPLTPFGPALPGRTGLAGNRKRDALAAPNSGGNGYRAKKLKRGELRLGGPNGSQGLKSGSGRAFAKARL